MPDMEATDLVPLIELLDDNIDDLEGALAPLLKAALSDTAGKLLLLDKAQLYVLVTYAIESILFSYLRLNGVNAKGHPVFRELTRVKQYFEKIKVADSAGTNPNTKLDKAAASRFIKHALAGNERYDLDKSKQQQREKNVAHTRFEDISKNQQAENKANRGSQAGLSSNDSDQEMGNTSADAQTREPTQESFNVDRTKDVKVKKGRRRKKKSDGLGTVSNSNATHGEAKFERKRARKALRKQQRAMKESQGLQTEG